MTKIHLQIFQIFLVFTILMPVMGAVTIFVVCRGKDAIEYAERRRVERKKTGEIIDKIHELLVDRHQQAKR